MYCWLPAGVKTAELVWAETQLKVEISDEVRTSSSEKDPLSPIGGGKFIEEGEMAIEKT